MRQMTLLKFGIAAVLTILLTSNAFGANQYKTRQNPFTGKPDYILGTDNLEVTNLTASGTVTGITVSATTALQVGSDYITDITGSGLSIVGGALTAGGSESTTVSDTTTINLTLTGSNITADGLYTAGDDLTLTGADFDVDSTVTRDTEWDTSLEILNAVTDETGTGLLTFATSPVLTTPDINAGTADNLTSLGIRSTGTGAFDLIFANTENLTVGAKTLTLTLNNANRVLTISGDATVSGTNTGDQTITLTGDVTGTGTGSFATTIAADSVALTTDTTGNYAAGDAEAGNALTGDSATSFFSTGTLEVAIGGTGTTTSTGTGAVVLGTSPALTTPNLGAVAAGSTWSLADTITALSVYTSTTSLEETTGATDSGGYIVGLFDEFAFSAGTDVQTVIDDLDNSIPDNYQYTLLPESSVLDDNNPPAITVVESSGTATPRFRVADFDGGSTNEILYWSLAIPDDYNSSGTITADVYWFTAGTSGNARWGIQVSSTTEADTTAVTAQAADTENGAQEAANGTANRLVVTTVTLTNNDSLTAGDDCVIVFYRDASDTTNDTLTNDARLLKVLLKIPRT